MINIFWGPNVQRPIFSMGIEWRRPFVKIPYYLRIGNDRKVQQYYCQFQGLGVFNIACLFI